MNRKGKVFLAVFSAAVLLMIIKGITAFAYIGSIFQYTYEGQTITYEVVSEPTSTENGTARIIYSRETIDNLSGDVIIPSTVTNQNMTYNVTRVSDLSFMDADSITSITLPYTVTAIEADAFRNCSSMKSINIPIKVTRIEEGTFYGCSSLTGLFLPEGLTYIGDNAFYNCAELSGIKVPKGVRYLGAAAFSGCKSLKSISIPEGITDIEEDLFENCVNLASVDMPEGIKSIGEDAFYNCNSLRSIHIPDSVTRIGKYAFYLCSSLSSVRIPYGVTKIEAYTFLECSNLTEVILQNKVKSIGDFAFYYCSKLVSIELPEGLTSIGNMVFYGCDNLRPITIPRSVTSIGFGEFPYCGVFVYKNSFAESFFRENLPKYYQVIDSPLKEMSFVQSIMNIGVNENLQMIPVFYPDFSSDITDTISWSSSNTDIVSVDSNGSIKGLKAGEADITAVMGNYSAASHIIVGGTAVDPDTIEFTNSNIGMNKGESIRLQLNFAPENATNRQITWTSSDNSVVTVENGRIYAKNGGTAEITAISAKATAKCTVTVYNHLKEIYSDYDNITLNKGETKKVAISYYPADTTDNTNTFWSSENISVATVENGVIKANNPGTTLLTATVGKFTKSIVVTVEIPLKSLSLTQKEISLTVGEKKPLPLTVLPNDTTDEIRITSSDQSVASYSGGTITALKSGTATITAVSGAFSVSCQVTVETDIDSIALNKSSLNLYLGGSETLAAAFNPVTAMDSRAIDWKSSDEAVITVDSDGKIKTVGIGTATVTATAGGNRTAACAVTVKLSVPGTIKAESGGYDKVKITWGAVSGASGYRIYRSESSTGSYTLLKDITSNSYTNTGLPPGKTYYYKVRGYRIQDDKKIYGSYTAIVSAIPLPETPANVKLVKTKAGTVTFTWNQVSGASGYEVYRTSSTKDPFLLRSSTTSLHFINSGLTKGKTYYYKVRAYRIVGNKRIYSNFSEAFSMKM